MLLFIFVLISFILYSEKIERGFEVKLGFKIN